VVIGKSIEGTLLKEYLESFKTFNNSSFIGTSKNTLIDLSSQLQKKIISDKQVKGMKSSD